LLFCLGPLLCLRNMYVPTVLVTNPMIGSFMSFSDGFHKCLKFAVPVGYSV
jgi:hypothetical protein